MAFGFRRWTTCLNSFRLLKWQGDVNGQFMKQKENLGRIPLMTLSHGLMHWTLFLGDSPFLPDMNYIPTARIDLLYNCFYSHVAFSKTKLKNERSEKGQTNFIQLYGNGLLLKLMNSVLQSIRSLYTWHVMPKCNVRNNLEKGSAIFKKHEYEAGPLLYGWIQEEFTPLGLRTKNHTLKMQEWKRQMTDLQNQKTPHSPMQCDSRLQQYMYLCMVSIVRGYHHLRGEECQCFQTKRMLSPIFPNGKSL